MKPCQKTALLERQEQSEIQTLCSLLQLPVYDVFSKLSRPDREKWVERTCLTKQVNVFMLRGLSKRNLEIRAHWLHLPWQPIENKYLHTDVTAQTHTDMQLYHTQSINISLFL